MKFYFLSALPFASFLLLYSDPDIFFLFLTANLFFRVQKGHHDHVGKRVRGLLVNYCSG